MYVNKCTLTKCTLTKCTLTKCTLTRCALTRCTLTRCTLTRCTLTRCKLTRCTLTKCTLTKSTLTKCTLTKCTLTKYCKLGVPQFKQLSCTRSRIETNTASLESAVTKNAHAMYPSRTVSSFQLSSALKLWSLRLSQLFVQNSVAAFPD